MSKNSIKPFELLSEYESLSLRHSALIKEQVQKEFWSGVGFSVDNNSYLIAIDKIIEVLILTEITKIPGIQSWVLGLGNIRGNLIPVVDLKSFLYHKPTKITAHTRMVILQQVGGQVGLVVDEVFGQKHFNENQLDQESVVEEEKLKYSSLKYLEGETNWNVLDTDMLINDHSFRNAATI